MKRFVIWATAVGFLVSGLPGYSAEPAKEATDKGAAEAAKAAPKKARKVRRHKKAHRAEKMSIADRSGSPFADVPKDHWAYEAVSKAVESGLLQGYENRFYGGRAMTRYQMAVLVARMLEKLAVLRSNGRMFTAQDIANLEALTIEFADELAMLNVKVSTLEEQTAVLRKDVDQLKYEVGPGGPRSPITGLVAARFAMTSSGSTGYGQYYTGAVSGVPASAATPSLLRYRGDVSGPGAWNATAPGTAGNPWKFDSRDFATIAQLSLNIDRQIAKDIEAHVQVDIDAEATDGAPWTGGKIGPYNASSDLVFDPLSFTGTFGFCRQNGSASAPFILGSGRGSSFFGTPLHVNEAYVQFNGWIGDSDGKIGVMATPFNVENNGPSRTYNWTLTPSIANTFWEGLRPTGVEFRNSRKEDYWLWNLGIFSNLDANNVGAGGTLLSGIQTTNGVSTPIDPLLNGVGFRFPTPRLSVMSDAPRGIDSQTETDNFGYYARIGGQHKDNMGFGWNLGYLDNGGSLKSGSSDFGTPSEWHAFNIEADYKWHKWLVLSQYYGGRTKNYTLANLNPALASFDARYVGRGSPFPNLTGQATDTDSWMNLVSYAWSKESSATVRYESAKDQTGLALIGAKTWTFAYNRKMGDKAMLQAEYITIDSRTRSEAGVKNDIDINDDLAQINYRLQF